MPDGRIELSDVTFGYGTDAVVRGVSFVVPGGAFVGIIGPNGSGKSTLLRLISGLLSPWSGRIAIDGCPAESFRRRELSRRIAVVPQETTVSFPFSVMEMVLLGRTPHLGGFGFEGDPDLRAARRAMQRTDTLRLAGRSIAELSGGERQRVIVARALAQEPAILLLDEPSAFLDIRHEMEIYDLLRDLQRDGMTVVSVLHDLNLAALYCEQLVLLRGGGCVARLGAPQDVMTYAVLSEVYETEIYVSSNDITGALNIFPLNRAHRERLKKGS